MILLIDFDTSCMNSYRQFLKLKSVPAYRWIGRTAIFDDEYASVMGYEPEENQEAVDFAPSDFCFDYQREIALLAIKKKKFAVFMSPGMGKTIIDFEFAHHALKSSGGKALIVAPLMVVRQMIEEHVRFYPGMNHPEQVRAKNLQSWLDSSGEGFGITNYEAVSDELTKGNLKCLILSESSMLKSHYGKWGTKLIELGKGLNWKLCETGTPAPNDRIEYANHAVFLDRFRTVNEFLAKYFVNRGETQNRWEIKPHALRPFYKDLSHWCIFLTNPAVYGWKDNTDTIPPIHIHIDRIELTEEQIKEMRGMKHGVFTRSLTGNFIVGNIGGIKTRGKLSQLAKGKSNGKDIETNKPAFIKSLIDSWPDESTLIWCRYNSEQEMMEKTFPDAGSISGDTPYEDRVRIIDDFKSGKSKVLISKPRVLGFGLNLQVATRQVFSGLQDSFEEFFQAIKRSNRIGSTRPLNVHIPVTDIEVPMIETVLSKSARMEHDTKEQELLFKELRMKQ